MKKFLAPFIAALLAAAVIFGGCGVNITTNESSLSASESSEPSAVQTRSTAESITENAQTEWTMEDIYKLENTDIFAKNTLEHIFDGTINSKGKATGYHYSKVSDSKGSIIDGTRSEEDGHGVFTAKVEVDGVRKNGFSSFYPESWTPQQVVDAINEAYEDALGNSSNPVGELWIGYSGDLEIDMYLNNQQKITTAFPIYEGD